MYPRRYLFCLAALVLILPAGCGPRIFISDTDVFADGLRTEYSLSDWDIQNTQFYLEGVIRLVSDIEDTTKRSGGIPGPIVHKEVVVREMTPGVVEKIGKGFLNVDFGDGLRFRFAATGTGASTTYRLERTMTYEYGGISYLVVTQNASDGDPTRDEPRLRVSLRAIREMKGKQQLRQEAPGKRL